MGSDPKLSRYVEAILAAWAEDIEVIGLEPSEAADLAAHAKAALLRELRADQGAVEAMFDASSCGGSDAGDMLNALADYLGGAPDA